MLRWDPSVLEGMRHFWTCLFICGSAGSRLRDGVGEGGEEAWSPKHFFGPYGLRFGLKIRTGPGPLLWIRHCIARWLAVYSDLWDVTVNYTCWTGERDPASRASFCLLESGGEKETLHDSRQPFEVAAVQTSWLVNLVSTRQTGFFWVLASVYW